MALSQSTDPISARLRWAENTKIRNNTGAHVTQAVADALPIGHRSRRMISVRWPPTRCRTVRRGSLGRRSVPSWSGGLDHVTAPCPAGRSISLLQKLGAYRVTATVRDSREAIEHRHRHCWCINRVYPYDTMPRDSVLRLIWVVF
jgi:hypothetical protein